MSDLTPERYQEIRKEHGTRCPECGVDLKTVDAKYHDRTHYPERIDPWPQHQLAIERQAYLREYAKRGGA